MAYIRKTKDEWHVQGFYAGEWETVTIEEDRKSAREMKKIYDENERYPHRVISVRVKKTEEELKNEIKEKKVLINLAPDPKPITKTQGLKR